MQARPVPYVSMNRRAVFGFGARIVKRTVFDVTPRSCTSAVPAAKVSGVSCAARAAGAASARLLSPP